MVVALGSLLTWLWHGTAVALGAAGVLRFGTRFNAATRYLVLWASLLAVLLLAPAALLSRMGGTGLDASHVSLAPAAEPHVLRAPTTLLPIELPLVPVWFGIALVATWASSAGLRLHAMRKSLTRMRHIKRVCAPLAGNIETQLPLWQSIRRRGRRARVCVSSEVGVASMLGLGQPTIVIPRSLVAALASDELDRIVVHEYGHVQRWDDWTNLIQLTIEAVAGWHPAIWWIGRALRLEREVACDDRVIARTTSAPAYASCLAKIAGLASPQLAAPIAPGATRSARELTRRVERLLDRGRNATVRPSSATLAAGTAALAIVVATLSQLSPLVAFQALAAPTNPVTVLRSVLIGSPGAMPTLIQPALLIDRSFADGPHASDHDAPRQVHPTTTHDWADLEPERLPLAAVQFDTLRPRQPSPQDVSRPPLLHATSSHMHPVSLHRGVSPRDDVKSLAAPPEHRPGRWGWSTFADAGKAIGNKATQAGLATAGGFSNVAAGLKSVFTGGG